MKRNIKAVSESKLLFGTIEVLNQKKENVYAKWILYDSDKNLIASFTNNYFIGNSPLNNDQVFELIKNKILQYRIGRNRIFQEIEFIKNDKDG
jgi:hypothetical protein